MSDERRVLNFPRFRSLSESDVEHARCRSRKRLVAALSLASGGTSSDLELRRVSGGDAMLGGRPSTTTNMCNIRRLTAGTVRRRLTFDSCGMDSTTSRSDPHIAVSSVEDGEDDDEESSRSSAQRLLKEMNNEMKREQEARWNFNFDMCRPHVGGRYEWFPINCVVSDNSTGLAARFPHSNARGFVPIERQLRCRADVYDDDDAAENWRPTAMANAQTQTRPEVDFLRAVSSRFDTIPQAVVDQNNNGESFVEVENGSTDEAIPMQIDDSRGFEETGRQRTSVNVSLISRRLHSTLRRNTAVTSIGRVKRQRRFTSSIKHHFPAVKKPTNRKGK